MTSPPLSPQPPPRRFGVQADAVSEAAPYPARREHSPVPAPAP